jgi:probable phosphoglycerate mutase
MRVLLFRHGAVRHDGEKLFLGRTDLRLSAEGRRQAAAWKSCFQEKPPDRIISSPLLRALEFARIMAGDRKADVAVCDALSEIDLGDWDGRPMRHIQLTEPASWQARGDNLARFRPPNGESFEDVQNRAVSAFKKLISQDASELMVVSHAGVNRTILCYLLDMPLAHLFRIGQDYASLSVIETGPGRIRARSINIPCPREKPKPSPKS